MPTKKLNIIVNQKGARQASSQMNSLGSSIAKTVGTYIGLGAAVVKVTSFLKDSVKLYGIQEQAEKKLATAIGYRSSALLRQASALQKMSVYGDEAIIGVQASIGAFIKDEQAIKMATKATLDMAAALGMDLKSAGDLVAKTLGSTTNALSRYGIEVKGAVGSTERLISLSTGIEGFWGGQAKAMSETTLGRLKQFSDAWSDLKEKIGLAIVENLNLKLAVENLTKLIDGRIHLLGREENAWEGSVKVHHRAKEEADKAAAAELKRQKIILANKEAYAAYIKKIEDEAIAREQAIRFQQKYIQQLARENGLHLDAIAPEPGDRMAAGMERIFAFDEATGKWITKLVQAKKELHEISTIPVDKPIDNANQSNKELITDLETAQMVSNTFFAIWSAGSERQRRETKAWALMAAYVNTAAGITKAFAEYGWPKGLIPAAAIAAAGAAQINSIQGREYGGPVSKNQPYIVGEAGPELIVPNQDSFVIPNNQLGGVIINFNGSITDRRFVQSYLIPEIKKAVQLGRA